MVVPDGMIAVGVPARVVGEVTGRAREWVDANPAIYRELARRHAAGARLVGSEPCCVLQAGPGLQVKVLSG
jgi:carbonic anhydrase/acetyltransferase-like protein (isoleucine patch superfamily)